MKQCPHCDPKKPTNWCRLNSKGLPEVGCMMARWWEQGWERCVTYQKKQAFYMEWAAEELAADVLDLAQLDAQMSYDLTVEMNACDAMRVRVAGMEAAGEAMAMKLEEACRELGAKNPRKTIPVLVAWDGAKKLEPETE